MARKQTENTGIPFSEWPVNQYELTRPQQDVVRSIPRFIHTALIGGNRLGKTELMFWLFVMAALGQFSCEACNSHGIETCSHCRGRSWAPKNSHFAIVSLSQAQGQKALQSKINQFALSLPYPQVLMQKVTRDGLTNPLVFAWQNPDGSWSPGRTGAQISICTEGQHWKKMQGAEYAGVGFDEQPDEQIHGEMQYRQRPGWLTRYLYSMTPTQGIDWFHRDFVATRREDTNIIYASVFENGSPPCQTCGKTRAEWEPILRDLGIPEHEWGLPVCAELCQRCRTYGVEPRMTAEQLRHMEDSARGDEKLMRMYGHFVDVGTDQAFTLAEKQALREFSREAKHGWGGRGIYCEPIPRRSYVLGCDSAEGIGRDESVCCVLDAKTGEQVAVWGDNETEPNGVVMEILELNMIFTRPCICVEAMSSGTQIIDALKSENVWLYEHRSPRARRNRPTRKQFGYRGGPTGSEFLKRQLVAAIKDTFVQKNGRLAVELGNSKGVYVYDRKTVEQLCRLAYDVEDNNKLRVPKAYHDDRIMALALAHEARQTRARWTAGVDDVSPTADKYLDYERQVIAQHVKRPGRVYGPEN